MTDRISIDGSVLAELRRNRMWAQAKAAAETQAAAEALGERCALTAGALSKIEGGHKAPSSDTLRYLIAALAPVSGADLRRLLAGGDPPAELARLARYGPVKEDHADRRDVTSALAALLAAAAAPSGGLGEALERIVDSHFSPVDDGLVASHEQASAELAGWYRGAPLQAAAATTRAYADSAVAVLDRPMTPTQRERMRVVVVGACAQSGLLALHAGNRVDARRSLALARSVGEDSGDVVLHGQALGAFSELDSPQFHPGDGGDPDGTVKLLDQAIAQTRRADRPTRAWLALWRAYHAVDARDLPTCRTQLEAAAWALQAPGGPEQGFFSPAGLFSGHNGQAGLGVFRAQVQGLEGNFDAADRALTQIAATMTGRGRVLALCDLAAVRVAAAQPEGACLALTRALDYARQIDYRVGIVSIRRTRDAFPPQWAALPCVRELDDRLRSAAA